MARFTDQLVVITGAGSGIGLATARAFAREGARIAACDKSGERMAALAHELGDRAALTATVDVAQRAEMAAFAADVARIGAVRIVVNNAGVGLGGPFTETSLDDWDWIIGVNLRGVVHGCHFFVPQLIAAGQGGRVRGQVINVASIFGIYAGANVSAYVATKFAVRGFSLALREELAPHGIGVTAICPGMIATSIIEDGKLNGAIDGRRAEVARTFHSRGASPTIVADAIVAAAHDNPAQRTVGTDARVLAALTRLAPTSVARVVTRLQRRLGL